MQFSVKVLNLYEWIIHQFIKWNDAEGKMVVTNTFQSQQVPSSIDDTENSAEYDIRWCISAQINENNSIQIIAHLMDPTKHLFISNIAVWLNKLSISIICLSLKLKFLYFKHFRDAFCKFCILFSQERYNISATCPQNFNC